MNKERLLQLADHLDQMETVESIPLGHNSISSRVFLASKNCKVERFWMSHWLMSQYNHRGHLCNTIGCIAGVTVSLFGHDEDADYDFTPSTQLLAKNLLGLTDSQAASLFTPHLSDPSIDHNSITAKDAAVACRRLVEGEYPLFNQAGN